MEVEVRLGKTPLLGTPRVRFAGGPDRLRLDAGYDVAPDGSGFVTSRKLPDADTEVPALTLVESWFEEFRPGAAKK